MDTMRLIDMQQRCIWLLVSKHHGCTRADLQRLTGYDAATIETITDGLVRTGTICNTIDGYITPEKFIVKKAA